MFSFASRVMASLIRRAAVVLALTLPASAWMIIAEAAPQASACDLSNHCYAVALNQNLNTNHGVYGVLNAHCLYQPNNNNQARAEIWDVDGGSSNWVEAGIISGVDYNGTYRSKSWLWADKRPGHPYFEHDFSATASTDTNYNVEIQFAGNDTWNIYGESGFTQYGTSTSNSATLVQAEGGTEYEGGSTSGIRDIAGAFTLERKSSSDIWYGWGANGLDKDSGSGNYINGHYDGNGNETWSGPC